MLTAGELCQALTPTGLPNDQHMKTKAQFSMGLARVSTSVKVWSLLVFACMLPVY